MIRFLGDLVGVLKVVSILLLSMGAHAQTIIEDKKRDSLPPELRNSNDQQVKALPPSTPHLPQGKKSNPANTREVPVAKKSQQPSGLLKPQPLKITEAAQGCNGNCLQLTGLGLDSNLRLTLFAVHDQRIKTTFAASDLNGLSSTEMTVPLQADNAQHKALLDAQFNLGLRATVENADGARSGITVYGNGATEIVAKSASSPVIAADGTIYVGAGNQLHALAADSDDGDDDTGLDATHQLLWSFTADDLIKATPSIDTVDGTIYVGSLDDNLYAIHPDGQKKWHLETQGDVLSSVVLGEDRALYFGSMDGSLYALNAEDGSQKWAFPANGGIAKSPVLVGDDTLYFTTLQSNQVHAISNAVLAWGSVDESEFTDEVGDWQPSAELQSTFLQVARLYHGLLQPPLGFNKKTLTFWTYQLQKARTNEVELAKLFLRSPTGQVNFPSTLSESAFVDVLYARMFPGQNPAQFTFQSQGVDYTRNTLIALLEQGKISRALVATLFAQSSTYGNRVDALLQHGFNHLYVQDSRWAVTACGNGDEYSQDCDSDGLPDGWELLFLGNTEQDGSDNFGGISNAEAFSRRVSPLCTAGCYDDNKITPPPTPTPTPVPTGDASIGAISGSHSVAQDGTAAYSIPIKLLPGVAGIQPKLSLSYNSAAGNGPLGVGWALTGTSSISRCPSSHDFGGRPDAVDFDGLDRFCLDGMPLVAVSGTYGKSNTEYRTQSETFSKVVSYGSVGSCTRNGVNVPGPEKFQVHTAAGEILEYGFSEDSRVEAVGCADVVEWALSKREDRFGNVMTVSYTEANGEHTLQSIEYNDKKSRVAFEYMDRPDPNYGYLVGTKIVETKLLNKVLVFEGTRAVRQYTLNYGTDNATGNSRLESIRECAGESGPCLADTTFTWSSENSLADFNFNHPSSGLWSGHRGTQKNNVLGDFNGDGLTDMAGYSDNPGEWDVCLSTGTGFTCSFWSGHRGTQENNTLGDFNGDGLTDMAGYSYDTGKWDVCLSTGTSFTCSFWSGHREGRDNNVLGDFNGDGLTDMAAYTKTRGIWEVCLSTGSDFNCSGWSGHAGTQENNVLGDFNGDGLTDMAGHSDSPGEWHVCLSTGTGFTCSFWSGHSGGRDNNVLGDFNGDGLTDMASYTETRGVWDVCLSTGIGFDCSRWNGHAGGIYNNAIVDFNGDGRSDMIGYTGSGGRWHLCFSEGDKFNCQYVNGHGGGEKNNFTGDFNGDGLTDMAGAGDVKGQWHVTLANGVERDRLKTVTNGFGAETSFHYELMITGNVYTPGTDTVSYPARHTVASSALVSSVTQSNGIGGTNRVDYRYKGLKEHQRGLGSLGFSEMMVTDQQTGISTTSTFNQGYTNRLQGTVLQVKTVAPNGVVLSDTRNQWQKADIGAGEALRYQVQLSQTTVTKKDLNGAFLHTEISDYTQYDDYGNFGKMETKLYDENDHLLRRSTTDNSYSNDINQWFIGQLTRVEVETEVTGRAPRKKLSTFSYDATTGRKTSEQIRHPETGAVLHNTQYGVDENGAKAVDAFGNNLAVTISGPDFASRTTKVTFDSTGRYLESQTNALGHTGSTSYYSASDTSSGVFPGSPKTTTDANGIVTRFRYDAFGRPWQTIVAEGTSASVTTTTVFRACDASCPSSAVYYLVESSGTGESRVYIDKLGRELRKSSQSKQDLSEGLKFVNIDYVYNNLGQNTRVSEPYFAGTASSALLWNTITYDTLGRAVLTVQADGRQDSVEYNGLTTSSHMDIHNLNQQKTLIKNPMGELITARDNNLVDTSYRYDSHGNLLAVNDPKGNVTEIIYDILGRKIRMDDPDKGVWRYSHNGIGQLVSQTNARGETTCNVYDLGGRLIKRIDNYQGGTSTEIGQSSQASNHCAGDNKNAEIAQWTYDTAPGAGLGKLHFATGTKDYREAVTYDNLGRAITAEKTVNGETFQIDTRYDNYSRPLVITYPGNSNRLQVRNHYNELGMLTEMRNAANDDLYYKAKELDSRGNVIDELYGNGVETVRGYEASTGRLTNIFSLSAAGILNVQALEFQFDKIGNLNYREDFNNNFREDMFYDSLNRLSTVRANFEVGGAHNEVRTTEVTYDELGNIRSKTGVGNYIYGGEAGCSANAGPHAVCKTTGNKNASYVYDNNGNMTSDGNRTIAYTLFDKAELIKKGSNSTEISYGPDRNRYFRRDTINGKVSEYTYVGGLYEKVEFVTANKIEERHFIGGFAVLTMEGRSATATGTQKTRYLHKDHLGSITTITNEIGDVVEEFSFDPWGKRRAPSLVQLEAYLGSWASLTSEQKNNFTIDAGKLGSQVTNKGFTGHEQMDGVGLIHMNGRVYDAEIGRFLSADPHIQDRTNLQALNRYSYVENNPLSYTDPSGYFLKKLFKKVRSAVKKVAKKIWNETVKRPLKRLARLFAKVDGLQQVVSIVLNMIPGCQVWCSMVFNAAMTLANGGSIADLATGLAVGLVTGGAGGVISGALDGAIGAVAAEYAGAALAGGAVAKAMGGDFKDGAVGGLQGAAIRHVLVGFQGTTSQDETANNNGSSPLLTDGNGEKYFINSDGNRAYTAGYFDQNGNPLLAQLDLPQGVVDFSAGFGDTMSFGATKWLRSKWGIGGVDYSSNYYTVGQAVGFVTPGFGTVAGLRGAAYLGRSHRWLNTGRHWRIGPGVISKAAGAKPFNYGAGRNIPMLRIGNKTPSSLNHFDLRILGK